MRDEPGGSAGGWPQEPDPPEPGSREPDLQRADPPDAQTWPGAGGSDAPSAGQTSPGQPSPAPQPPASQAIPGQPSPAPQPPASQVIPGQPYPALPLPPQLPASQAYPGQGPAPGAASRPAPALPGDLIFGDSGQSSRTWMAGSYPPGAYGSAHFPPGEYPPPGGHDPGGFGGSAGNVPPGTIPPGGYFLPGGGGPGYGQGGYPPGPAPRKRRGFGLIAYLLVAALAAGAGAGVVAWLDRPNAAASRQNTPTDGGGQRGAGTATMRAVVRAVEPGVVDISSHLGYEGGAAAATGMVISSDGIVLTNNHVIDGTTKLVAVVVATNQHFTARWLGFDKTADVAVIKLIGAHGLKTVPLGNSATIKVGATVVALGNAYGSGSARAVTGTITGLNKQITASDGGGATSETLTGMLQTNARIVPGDSGGPMANGAGQVIGMDTAAASASNVGGTQLQNVAFAIPINRVLAIAHKILTGQATPQIQIGPTGFLGVLVPAGRASSSPSPAMQRRLQLQQDQPGPGFPVQRAGTKCLLNDQNAGVPVKIAPASTGALVTGDLCGTPAAKAGITAGDVITGVGTHQVASPSQLTTTLVGHFRPGQTVTISWMDIRGHVHHAALLLVLAPPR